MFLYITQVLPVISSQISFTLKWLFCTKYFVLSYALDIVFTLSCNTHDHYHANTKAVLDID